VQGEWPSHPELLDWLATEFVQSGWDIKHIQKLIVLSATYRQSSAAAPALFARDPENRLLARGPRIRLQAEFIRDLALSASGLLNPDIGGKSVTIYQPENLWEEIGYRSDGLYQKFTLSQGRDLYKRSLYTYWKRTVPPPSFALFDAPSRETCTVYRPRTNTPLQALALMNDPTYLESARKLAEHIMTDGGATIEQRLTYAFRLATSRKPTVKEIAVLQKVFTDQLAAFRKDPEQAKKLLGVGMAPRNEKLDPAELAAWTMIASVILNLDETMTKG
jgi:hypothetical protein